MRTTGVGERQRRSDLSDSFNPERLDAQPCLKRQNTQKGKERASRRRTSDPLFRMKRHGHLFEKMVDDDLLCLAVKRACKPNGRTSPSKQRAIAQAKADIKGYAAKVKQLLLDGFQTSSYTYYPLFDPKLRFIYSLPFYPDRIIHHVLLCVLEPIWDGLMMPTSYACRKGRGQHQAGQLCAAFTRKFKYVAQFDVSQFYISINHKILKTILRKKIKDEKVLGILDEIIDSISTRDKNLEMLYKMRGQANCCSDVEREIKKLETSKAKDNGARAGLPIGSYTSQWFGNLYMNELDNFLKQNLRCKAVIRYCDDFLVFSNDKAFLQKVKSQVKAFMWERLHLLLSKAEVFPTAQGVDFCGYRYFPEGYVLLRKRTAKKQKTLLQVTLKRYRQGTLSPEKARARIASLDGWMRWAKCHHWKKHIGFYDIRKEICGA